MADRPSADASPEAPLREVVEALAPLERRAGSDDERRAAAWIAGRLERAGAPARVEEELFRDGYARQMLPLGLAAGLAGALALSGRSRPVAAGVAAATAAAIVDDVSNGPRLWRRLTARPKPTWNVVAEAGDRSAERTLVVMAHHDAAPTGHAFDQSGQRAVAARFPGLIQRMNTSLPLWWPVAGAPALVALGAATASRGVTLTGTVGLLLTTALGADIARSPIVPGANDNLSAVAALVGLAERLRERPLKGLRVMLVSCGAEEVLQGGIYGFAKRHFPRLRRDRTWMLNLETIGSPELVLIEGEGPFRMRDYHDPSFRDLIARAADRAGLSIHRGVRSRASSDAVIPSRAGYPTAMVASWEPETKALSNYHLMTDTPENLRYDTVARGVTLADAVARELAG